VGETEFVNGVAAMSASGLYGPSRLCAGIVGYADLTLGDAVRPVLEAHIDAGGGRFRGIRHTLCWDEDARLLNPAYPTVAGMAASARFRTGFAHLEPLGLGFDAWCLFHQLPEVAELARAFPGTRIVVDHCGGIVGIGAYQRDAAREVWLQGIRALAACPNVWIKLSGLGMRLGGFGFEARPHAPSSAELARAWEPWVMPLVEQFGADRCLWGSNFPVDKGSYAYGVGINAYKRLLKGCSPSERDAIFHRSAARYYRLSSAEPTG
jgi:predicted TIM-barrel fold metal-dependent hydrolase